MISVGGGTEDPQARADAEAALSGLSGVDARLDVIEPELSGLEGDVTSGLSGLDARVDALEADVSGIQLWRSGMSGAVAGLQADVSDLQDGQSGLSGVVAGLQADVSDLQDGQSGLSGAVAGLQADVSDLQDGQSGLSGSLAGHIADTNNPHQVTASQAGADPAGTAAGLTWSASAVALGETSTTNIPPNWVTKVTGSFTIPTNGNYLIQASAEMANSDADKLVTARITVGGVEKRRVMNSEKFRYTDGAWHPEVLTCLEALTAGAVTVLFQFAAGVDKTAYIRNAMITIRRF